MGNHHHTRATFVTRGILGHDEHALPCRSFLAPAPSRAAALTRKEIRCTLCHPKETIEFVNPTRKKMRGSRNMKTCRRRAGALDRVDILTVFGGEDATQ